MKRLVIFGLAGLFFAGCGEAAQDAGVHIEDAPAAISEQEDDFRSYANLTLTDGNQEERYSFYLDHLDEPMSAFRGCSGQTFAVCGSAELAYCSEGVWLGANNDAPLRPGTACAALPDRWELERLVKCPLDEDQMAKIERISQHNQSNTTQPAPDYLGEPVVAPEANGTTGGQGGVTDPSSTDGTTQPGSDSNDSDSSGSGESGSLSGTSSGTRSGASSTSQPGRL
jgi:hypothetical protein